MNRKTRLAKSVTLLIAASAVLVVLSACGEGTTSQNRDSGETATSTNSNATSTPAQPQTTTPQAGTSGTTAGEIDTCSLITKEEAKEAVGGEVKNMTGEKANCRYVSANGMVMVDYFPGSSSEGMANLIASQGRGGKSEPLAGVGDKAYLITPAIEGLNAKSVFVSKGNVVLMITVNREKAPVTADEMKELTAKIVGRLP